MFSMAEGGERRGQTVSQGVREVSRGLTLWRLPDRGDKYKLSSYCCGQPLEVEVERGEELMSSELHF